MKLTTNTIDHRLNSPKPHTEAIDNFPDPIREPLTQSFNAIKSLFLWFCQANMIPDRSNQSICPAFDESQVNIDNLLDDIFEQIFSICSSLQEQVESLKNENNELKSRLNQNSGNSNWPSSMDKPNQKQTRRGHSPSERNQGGQPGRERKERPPLNDQTATETVNHEVNTDKEFCPYCGGSLIRDPALDQQYDQFILPQVELEKIRNIVFGYRCQSCGRSHRNAPKEITDAGLLGHSLLAFLLFLKTTLNASIRKLQLFLSIHLNEHFSTGYISDRLKFAANGLWPIYLEMCDHVKSEPVLNIDETTHRLSGKKCFTWVFAGANLIVYKISNRSADVLFFMLGEQYTGIIGSDCYGGYHKFAKHAEGATLQLCLVHLRRDFKACADYFDASVAEYGERNLKLVDEIISTNNKRLDVIDTDSELASELTDKLYDLKSRLIESAKNTPPVCKKAQAIGKRFEDFPELYFTFIDHPEVNHCNNYAERSIRPVVVARKVNIGTESLDGNLLCEILWSITETAKLLNINANDFLIAALSAYYEGRPLPSLVNYGSCVDQKYVEQAQQEQLRLDEAQKRFAANKRAAKEEKLRESKKGANNRANEPSKSDCSSDIDKAQPSSKGSYTATETPPAGETSHKPDSATFEGKSTSERPISPFSPQDNNKPRPPDGAFHKPISGASSFEGKPTGECPISPLSPNEQTIQPPLSDKERESQQELLSAIFSAIRASGHDKAKSRKDNNSKASPKSSTVAKVDAVKPPALKPNTRQLKAPGPVIKSLEPALPGLNSL
jgi:transposase